MFRDDLFAKVKAAIEPALGGRRALPTSRFVEDLGLDSLDVLSNLYLVEEATGIFLPQTIPTYPHTINDLLDMLEEVVRLEKSASIAPSLQPSVNTRSPT